MAERLMPGKSLAANGPNPSVNFGMPVAVAGVRQASPTRLSLIPNSHKKISDSSSPVQRRVALPGICSLLSRFSHLMMPGVLFWLTPVVGRSRWPIVMLSRSWQWKALAFGFGTLVSNSFSWLPGLMRFFFLCLTHFSSCFAPGSCASFAIEPESGTEMFRCRFTVFVPL